MQERKWKITPSFIERTTLTTSPPAQNAFPCPYKRKFSEKIILNNFWNQKAISHACVEP